MPHTCWIPASVFQWCTFKLWTETHLQAAPSALFSGKQEKGMKCEDAQYVDEKPSSEHVDGIYVEWPISLESYGVPQT